MEWAGKEEARLQFTKAPAFFIKNKGQLAKEVKYYFKGNDSVYFTDEGVVFQKTGKSQESGIESHEPFLKTRGTGSKTHDLQLTTLNSLAYRLDFVSAKHVSPKGRNELKSKVNCFIGNNPSKWHTDISTYKEIIYPELYEGIDLVYKGVPGGMKYEFIVQPGANPDVIRLAYNGIEGLSIDDSGNLIIHTALGDVKDEKPHCCQEINGKVVEVSANFKLNPPLSPFDKGENGGISKANGKFVYGFEITPYNKNYPLIIDPGLEYSTFIGGSNPDGGVGIAVDGSGNAYVTGYSESTNFPTTNEAYDTSNNGGWDVVVIKLATSGAGSSDLLYATYIGGNNTEEGVSIAVDGSGDVYLTGPTLSTNFPITLGAYDTSHNGSVDTFVTKLSTSGSGNTDLLYSTFLGGSEWDVGYDISADGSGNVYLTGQTKSANFPTTTGAYDTSHNGSMDAFVTKLSTLGSGSSDLLYSTVLGGSGWDEGNGMAVDGSGNVYVTGRTESANFPTTTGAYDTSHNGNSDVFMTKLTLIGSGFSDLLYSTLLGGDGDDAGWDIAEDGSGNTYLTGLTESINFPTTAEAYDTSHNGSNDVFVTKVSPSGLGSLDLLYSTFLGDSSEDYGYGITVDNGNAYITGYSESINFPTTPRAYDTNHNGEWDIFVSKLTPSGSGVSDLLYSTFLGGNSVEEIWDIAVDGSGNAYVAGRTSSPNFPTTVGAYDTSHNSEWDVFVAKLSPETVVCQCQTGSPKGCVSGMVTKKATGESLAGKTVILRRKSPRTPRVRMKTTTDSNGCYQFVDLEDGTYKVKLNRRQCGRVREKVIIEGGAKVNDVNLECRR